MTPVTYNYLQSNGFRLLIPIVSQNEKPRDEALVMWGREMDGKMIRLEHHKTSTATPQKTDPAHQAHQAHDQDDFVREAAGAGTRRGAAGARVVQGIERVSHEASASLPQGSGSAAMAWR